MKEILRSNDPVQLSYVEMVLRDAGLHPVLFDGYTSMLEGSISAIQRRLMVLDEEEVQALEIIAAIKADDQTSTARDS